MKVRRGPLRFLGWLTSIATALAILLAIAGCAANSPTDAIQAPKSTPAPVPPLAGPHITPTFNGISMISSDDGWVIGRDGYYNGIGAFLLHYKSGYWRLEPFPAVVDAKLATPTSIAMVAADAGWIAAKLQPDSAPVILHMSAGAWAKDSLPAGMGAVTALSAPSAQDAWALSVGQSSSAGGQSSAILRYQQGGWTVEASFPGVSLAAISMDSADDGWAVGSDSAGPTLLHYTQGAWTRIPPAALHGVVALTGVSMASPSTGWASGLAPAGADNCTECGGAQPQRVVLRFQDGGWQQARETQPGIDELPNTFTSDEQFLSDSVAAGADGSGWVAREHLTTFAPNGPSQVLLATCKSDFLGMALAPTPANTPPEGWIIGSHGQLFHLAHGGISRYNTGALCDPLT